MKIVETKAQFSVPSAAIFVPGWEADRMGNRGVELGTETFYSLTEISDREASAHGSSAREELHEPQRKLVKFFARSRDRWKAKSRVAKTLLKRLGTRLGRLERRNAAYQEQLAALHTQVAQWQAQHAQTVRELEELKKKYPQLSADH